MLREWGKSRTDQLLIQESPDPVSAEAPVAQTQASVAAQAQ
jgi:hypothetical protein